MDGGWGCCECCPLPVKGRKVSKYRAVTVILIIIVINFLVDVVVWRSFYLNSCLSMETSFQGFGGMTKGHIEGPMV